MSAMLSKFLLPLTALVVLGFASSALATSTPDRPSSTPGQSVQDHTQSMIQGTALFDHRVTPPDINTIPSLKAIVTAGGKLTYIGKRGKIYAWYYVQDGRVNVIYVKEPDPRTSPIHIFDRPNIGDGDLVPPGK